MNASSRTSLIAAPTNVCSTFADSLAALVSASPLVLSNKNVKIDIHVDYLKNKMVVNQICVILNSPRQMK